MQIRQVLRRVVCAVKGHNLVLWERWGEKEYEAELHKCLRCGERVWQMSERAMSCLIEKRQSEIRMSIAKAMQDALAHKILHG